MADTSLQINQGSGEHIDTRTESTNGNHRQVVVIGDPATNAGVAPVDPTNGLAVDVKQSALPTGASTSAKQDTGNTSLSSIDGKLATLGQKTKSNSTPVVLASDQDAVPVSGNIGADLRVGSSAVSTSNPIPVCPPASGALPISASALPLPTGASTESTLASIKSKTDNIPALGQAVAGSSVPVVLPSAQITTLTPQTDALTNTQLRATAVPVSVATVPSHDVTNAGTFATQSTIQAGTALIGKVSSSGETTTIYNGTTALTPKFAKIDISASADIVALVASKKIRVVSMFLIASADCTLKFQSGGTTDLQGAMTIKAGAGFVLGKNEVGWFETASGEKLNAVVSGTTQISGSLNYIEV